MSKPGKQRNVVLCHCNCPFWGKRHDHVYRCLCRCGREIVACGYCLEAGRVASCPKCNARDLATGAGQN